MFLGQSKMVNLTALVLAALLLIASSGVLAQEEQQPWTHPDVLKAAVDIQMSQEQWQEFRAAITRMLQGYSADVQRLLNGRARQNLPRRIAAKRRQRVATMDEEMTEILEAEQLPLYEVYRDTLLQKMDERAAARQRGR